MLIKQKMLEFQQSKIRKYADAYMSTWFLVTQRLVSRGIGASTNVTYHRNKKIRNAI
jgi:hypothetical protein